MYVITGATGNIGSELSKLLLENGKHVKAVSRNGEKIKDLIEKGAEPAIGDQGDVDFLTKTFTG
ncbi:MAG TPA: NAD(P)H-binding protein, partial [Cytophagaceae bacterium]